MEKKKSINFMKQLLSHDTQGLFFKILLIATLTLNTPALLWRQSRHTEALLKFIAD